ncbi:MAG: VOC family protein [Bryobacteraceae bacterium]
MTTNRSVPVDTILPHLFYQDVASAMAWLAKVFGFREHYRYGDPVQGGQMHLGEAWIMLASIRPGRATPAQTGLRNSALTVFVEDVDGHYEKAKAAGAKILEEPNETAYGERQYAAEDIEGHQWLFSKHAQDVSPEQWGAVIFQD